MNSFRYRHPDVLKGYFFALQFSFNLKYVEILWDGLTNDIQQSDNIWDLKSFVANLYKEYKA